MEARKRWSQTNTHEEDAINLKKLLHSADLLQAARANLLNSLRCCLKLPIAYLLYNISPILDVQSFLG